MVRGAKIKKVIINYPTPENQEEYERRTAEAVAKILCECYPLDVIDQLISALKES
ncbi:hypothetical protein [Hathewaya limosa]|uniref:Uncharacterized protein n=1 Tax=Hathewaya limosa TaxID=1536 RepID=A0ABU0JUK3_HATLI|nr:hypothetical protein [Hathewaya limosa]MDQ0479739.1 hypothetical protein [Hathewaya limosa]